MSVDSVGVGAVAVDHAGDGSPGEGAGEHGFRPRNILDQIIWDLHENMEPGVELDFVAGVRRYVSLHEATDLNSFSAYAGTDFRQHVDDALSHVDP